MEARLQDALRRIYEADRSLADDGREPEQFRLVHTGGMQSKIEHSHWDPSWATPSEHTIDDLEELGYLRVEPHANKQRIFALKVKGRQRAEELLPGSTEAADPGGDARGPGDSYTDEERRRYAEQAQAELDLAVRAFLSRVGTGSFTAEELAEAVQRPKFEITAAVQWLRAAHANGIVSPSGGGGWRVNQENDGVSFQVRVAPVKAHELMSGPIYEFDLSEAEVLQRFVAPYQQKLPISSGDRTLSSYRKPKIVRIFGSGAEVLTEIRHNLSHAGGVSVPNQAEELVFEKASQDVTDTYILPSAPAQVDPSDAPSQAQGASSPHGEEKQIFLVHGHARKEEVARFIESVTNLRVVILDEQAGRSRAVIDKFEQESAGAAYAVVLLTADDLGAAKAEAGEGLTPRARQNVVLELGYFIGKIGRENVVALHEDGVELPSDYGGIEYLPLGGEWKLKLMSELRAAGFQVVVPGSE